jgi:hypothetical protein
MTGYFGETLMSILAFSALVTRYKQLKYFLRSLYLLGLGIINTGKYSCA